MARSGAALHAHECRDIVPDRRADHGARWVAICACGEKSIGITLASAAEKQRAHATGAMLTDTGAAGFAEVALVLGVLLAVAEWSVDLVKLLAVLH